MVSARSHANIARHCVHVSYKGGSPFGKIQIGRSAPQFHSSGKVRKGSAFLSKDGVATVGVISAGNPKINSTKLKRDKHSRRYRWRKVYPPFLSRGFGTTRKTTTNPNAQKKVEKISSLSKVKKGLLRAQKTERKLILAARVSYLCVHVRVSY